MKAIEKYPTLLTRLNAVKKHGPFSAYQPVLLKEIITILKPLEAASNDFQADFETVGNVIPAYLGLMNALTLTIKDRSGVQIANSEVPNIVKILQGFRGWIAGISRVTFLIYPTRCKLRSILDPRFKCAWIKLAGLNEKTVLDAVSSEIELRYDLLRSSEFKFLTDKLPVFLRQINRLKSSKTLSRPTDLSAKPSSNRKRRLIIELQRPRSVSGPAKLLEEFDIYLKEPIVDMEVLVNPMNPNSDLCATKPLEYWKSNQCRFWILSEIGRDVVSVAASSGSVERAFSVASDILTAKRSAMKPDLFANLMLVKCNAGLKVVSGTLG
uniref:HAT C-terminal dimerisation domain-containing protein n=1 Tax=Daphnia galeata TaxID=27404 RepID=A0A8J2RBZ7_9CRUS|nr:unnamed protein product [Daphnia galeata]